MGLGRSLCLHTAMGDAVNLASRLEGQQSKKPITSSSSIGEGRRGRAAPSWAALELDLEIAVKGKGPEGGAHLHPARGRRGVPNRSVSRRWPGDLRGDAGHAIGRRIGDGGARRGPGTMPANKIHSSPIFYGLYEGTASPTTTRKPPGPEWEGVFIAETK